VERPEAVRPGLLLEEPAGALARLGGEFATLAWRSLTSRAP
jgi:hypothetical protein